MRRFETDFPHLLHKLGDKDDELLKTRQEAENCREK